MHQPDPKVPYEDSIGELGKLQKEGKIRHIGVSNVTADQFAQARSLVKVSQYRIDTTSSPGRRTTSWQRASASTSSLFLIRRSAAGPPRHSTARTRGLQG